MKRYGYILFGLFCLLIQVGCTAGEMYGREEETPEQEMPVPVTLRAGSTTRAVVNEGDAFEPVLVCSDREDFSGGLRWQKNATVDVAGEVAYEGETPAYPSLGDNIYVAGLNPQGAILPGDGTAVYTLDANSDLMYAAPLKGNRWDGFRICGNTDATKDKVMEFNHLLSQVQLAAIRTAKDLAGLNDFRITKVTWKNVATTATVQLKPVVGEGEEQVSFSTVATLPSVLYKDKNDETKTVLVTSHNEAAPDAVGYALLPPAGSYLADVETSVGTFTDLTVKPDEGGFEGGYAHQIVLVLNDKGLSIRGVRLEDWENIDGGVTDAN